MIALELQYHYASMKINATPIDSISRNGKIWLLFNEIDNYIPEKRKFSGILCFRQQRSRHTVRRRTVRRRSRRRRRRRRKFRC